MKKQVRKNGDDSNRRDGKRLDKKGRKLILQLRKETFRCFNCKFDVPLVAVGTTQRNHCPICLWSRHVDDSIGDRQSDCGGKMKTVGLTLKSDGELMLIHLCMACNKISKNRIAGDDNDVSIVNLFLSSKDEKVVNLLKEKGISLLYDEAVVARSLYGTANLASS